MRALNLALALIGVLVLLFGLGAGFLRSRIQILSEPLVALGVGVLVGPAVGGLLELSDWAPPSPVLQEVARLAVAFAVTGAALRLPDGYFRRRARSLALLLGPGMLLMWAAGSLLAWAILGLEPLVCLLIGAVLTPTDPVLAGSLLASRFGRERLPADLRHTLSAEAGANDGLAVPFVMLAVLLLHHPPAAALSDWLGDVLLRTVGLGILFGLALGWAAGRLQRWSERRPWSEDVDLLTVTLALTLGALGGAALLGAEGILAAFFAGVAFNEALGPDPEEEEQRAVQETVHRLLTAPAFLLFGIALPWDEWGALGSGALLFAAAVLLLRRLPAWLLLGRAVDAWTRRADVLFAGWFGPIGIAALYYASYAARHTPHREAWLIGSLVVAVSILVHGMTSTPFTEWYARATGADRTSDPGEEGAPALADSAG